MAYGGFCPDMAELVRIAAKHGVAIVEDACHAPLARYEGRRIGTFGLAGCFSFFSNKNLATGEGGAIVTSDPEAAARLRRLRSHGMTTLTWDRHRGHAADYDVLEPGHNYRFDELRAAIGLEQLAKLPALTELRRKAAAKLRLALESLEIDNLEIPFTKVRGDAVHHLFVILLPPSVERAIFRKKMADSGVQTSLHYPLPNRFGMARAYFPPGETRLPVAESVEKRLVTLPMGPHLNDEAIAMIAEAVRESLTE
jgi:dTDP-4-amino-4,6-dideoxygalactose transaminase